MSKIERFISKFAIEFDDFFKTSPQKNIQKLHNAMKYSIKVGGKRLRPLFLIEISKIFNVKKIMAFRAAAAIELIHCYSLVHDDLPAMDDDDLRRGHIDLS